VSAPGAAAAVAAADMADATSAATVAHTATATEPPYRLHRYPSQLIDRVTLRDGRSVIVRPVLPQDDEAEAGLVQALSPRSRRLRFHGAVRSLPPDTLRAMTWVDYRRHVALVAELRCDDCPPTLVADARYVRDEADEASAEFAVAVADDWQGHGLGRVMLERLARHARQQGVTRLTASVLADNEPMLALLQRFGFMLRGDRHDASLLHARLELPAPGERSQRAQPSSTATALRPTSSVA